MRSMQNVSLFLNPCIRLISIYIDTQRCKAFLHNLNLPKLDDTELAEVGRPISLEELHCVLKGIKKRKAPSPDGIPPELQFWDILGPGLREAKPSGITKCYFHTHLNTALIFLLAKMGKYHTECSNFHPMLLINS